LQVEVAVSLAPGLGGTLDKLFHPKINIDKDRVNLAAAQHKRSLNNLNENNSVDTNDRAIYNMTIKSMAGFFGKLELRQTDHKV
jgi:hypothetical protein